MILEVVNHELQAETVNIIAIASSSIFLVGDTNSIQLACAYDTPMSSFLIGPLVPLATRS
ncbi:hypothetical protein [Bacillus andreraoultii]|uniref:hypothetical protein n=1 Tax=Bacillus andreraoultii TaxID=1499685 RepID=UPI00053A4372|nr:hypothetical protein [Bacillus andreraoultii]